MNINKQHRFMETRDFFNVKPKDFLNAYSFNASNESIHFIFRLINFFPNVTLASSEKKNFSFSPFFFWFSKTQNILGIFSSDEVSSLFFFRLLLFSEFFHTAGDPGRLPNNSPTRKLIKPNPVSD